MSRVRTYTVNNDWLVEQDGVVVARFPELRYGRNAVFFAARLANDLREKA